ncbi:patatin-like phospholipase family protein [Jannaschia rubra]|uniref:Patatin-like phospholipase n=1 Tax=Jannaschia rubra TaxID=282197 RepID=A0A0M6XNQ6_9RHOB|nr:patatin-like phospholipase family protein [Jannaschia rubra]CTQ32227.1 Patatin-like phospholipase [Jannaschia rubra]SFG34557.1 Patatin-like phospholipase [Jannaschia rubra]
MTETLPYDQLVFSGGGTRCFWQGGFLHVLQREMDLTPSRIAAVSGGALSAVGFVTHRGTRIRDTMIAEFARHDRNLPVHEPFDERAGNSPHQRIYRRVVESCIGDAGAARQVAEGPSVQILLARPPTSGMPKLSGSAVILAYEADLTIRSTPHLAWAEATGLTPECVDANRAARDGKLCDLVCAAATIPPAFDPPLWDGKPAVDAGMIDQAPLPDPDKGRTLILLTRQYRNLPDVPGRTYLSPSEEVPADKIDFTDASKLRDTWRIGEEDARRFVDGRHTD